MIDKITLFIPYFESKSVIRQQEFIYCLRKNIQIESVVDIYLLIDDGKDPEVVDDKIKIINIDHRPTYRDWINYTDQLITSGISVLLNTDIYFEDSIVKIHEIFKQDPYGFVALSRYELSKDDLSLHTQPKWSQ
ncbi:MAG: hypothetical protein IBX56_06260, partial [Methylomicrobium sp.]|nr:hypothetical protein [Methylomicrobium sp.]